MTPPLPRRVLVTDATSRFGGLVIDSLLKKLPAARLAAAVRDPDSEAAGSLRDLGVDVRFGDYTRPESLDAAFAGVERLLMLPSTEIGQRVTQHCNVIAAARRAGVGLIAYTSVLHADASPSEAAEDHCQTEAALRVSRAPFVLLRNGWRSESVVAFILAALSNSAIFSHFCAARETRIASAACADYAEAAAAALVSHEDQRGRAYELAGDEAYSLPKIASELARQLNKSFSYWSSPKESGGAPLVQAGFPDRVAAFLAKSNTGAECCLVDERRQLSALIGRPTTPLPTTITQLMKTLNDGDGKGSFCLVAAGGNHGFCCVTEDECRLSLEPRVASGDAKESRLDADGWRSSPRRESELRAAISL
jgi:NAD(P)H dehydrogenase (quinone)